jgi:hypothetical protein
MCQIMHVWLAQQFSDDIRKLVLEFAAKSPEVFLSAIQAVGQQIGATPDLAKRLCDLVSVVSFAVQNPLGTRGSLAIAQLAVDAPSLAEIASVALDDHARRFGNVDRVGAVVVIGLDNGVVHVFKKHKKVGEVKLMAKVDAVSVSPGERHACVVSFEARTIWSFDIPSAGFFRRKEIIPIRSVLADAPQNGRIIWRDEKCDYVFYS